MSLPWIKVAVDLPDHPKLDVFDNALGLWEGCGRGIIVSLWCWTARLYPDGRIPKISWRSMTRNAVANPPDANGKPMQVSAESFVAALAKAKLGTVRGDFLVLHDWDEFNSAHARKAEANREAVRRFREKVAREEAQDQLPGTEDGNAGCNGPGNGPRNVPGNACNAYESALEESREEENKEKPPSPPLESAGGSPKGPVRFSRTPRRGESLATQAARNDAAVVRERSAMLIERLSYQPMSTAEMRAYLGDRWRDAGPAVWIDRVIAEVVKLQAQQTREVAR